MRWPYSNSGVHKAMREWKKNPREIQRNRLQQQQQQQPTNQPTEEGEEKKKRKINV